MTEIIIKDTSNDQTFTFGDHVILSKSVTEIMSEMVDFLPQVKQEAFTLLDGADYLVIMSPPRKTKKDNVEALQLFMDKHGNYSPQAGSNFWVPSHLVNVAIPIETNGDQQVGHADLPACYVRHMTFN